jgi:spermidine synthase
LALAVIALASAAFASSLDPLAAPFYMRSTKDFPNWSKQRIVARLSNSISTVDVFKAEELTGLWGLSDQRYALDTHGRPFPERVGFCIDGWALTFGYHAADGDIVAEPVFDYLPAGLVYSVAQPESALIIGAGGGIDVISALRRGVPAITAVEINRITMDVSLAMSSFNGGIFTRKGVEPVVAEGRAFVAASGARRWDTIQLSGVDTLAASQAGAFTLAESYLYTREAFESYLQHLTPGGILTLTRWMSDPPRQTLRVITLADAALRSLGIRDTAAHIMLITDVRQGFSVFLISPRAFTPEQSAHALALTRERGFTPLALPHQTLAAEPNLYESLLATPDKSAFVRDYPFDISVTTDDRPFFFEHTKWKNAWKYPDRIFDKFNGHLILIATALLVALLGVVFILVPARYGLSRERLGADQLRTLGYFACLGLGYVLVEMVLVQKLTLYLGNPAYALAVVLCGMLMFSGLGSLLSAKLRPALAAGAVALALLAARAVLDPVLHATLAQSTAARIALSLGLLGLVATWMGMPFPAAVAALGEARRGLVVRGWVVNGYCSVLGSCVAMIVSISIGFGAVLLIAAALYALAAWLWHRTPSR